MLVTKAVHTLAKWFLWNCLWVSVLSLDTLSKAMQMRSILLVSHWPRCPLHYITSWHYIVKFVSKKLPRIFPTKSPAIANKDHSKTLFTMISMVKPSIVTNDLTGNILNIFSKLIHQLNVMANCCISCAYFDSKHN